MGIQRVKFYKYECDGCYTIRIEPRDQWQSKTTLPDGWSWGDSSDGFERIYCEECSQRVTNR